MAFTVVCDTKFLPMMVRSHYITEIMAKATDTAESQQGCGDRELSAPSCVCGTATATGNIPLRQMAGATLRSLWWPTSDSVSLWSPFWLKSHLSLACLFCLLQISLTKSWLSPWERTHYLLRHRLVNVSRGHTDRRYCLLKDS